MFIVPLSQISTIFPTGEVSSSPQNPAAPGGAVASVPFASMLKDAMQTVEETRAVSSQNSVDLALGNMDDLHTMQIASTKASTAVEFTVGLASRALSAYNEILRMQI